MGVNNIEYVIVFIATYLLVMLTLLAYKAALNDLYIDTKRKVFREFRAVHPLALLAAFVSMAPMALVRQDIDTTATTYTILGATAGYFVMTLVYRYLMGIRLMDFSIDNGSNFNDEISADPTAAQQVWLFLVSWAGALTLGTVSGFLISYNSWKDDTSWLTDIPPDSEARMYLLFFAGVVFVSLVFFVWLNGRTNRHLPTAQKLRTAINRSWFVPALIGLMFAFLQDYTRNTTLTNRYWTVFIIVAMVLLSLWNSVFIMPSFKQHMAEDRVHYKQRQKALKQHQRAKRRKRRR